MTCKHRKYVDIGNGLEQCVHCGNTRASEEKDAIIELTKRVKILEKSVEKLKERPSMYELMGMTDPNEPWIGEGYRKIQAEIAARDVAKESPISKGELVVKKKEDAT